MSLSILLLSSCGRKNKRQNTGVNFSEFTKCGVVLLWIEQVTRYRNKIPRTPKDGAENIFLEIGLNREIVTQILLNECKRRVIVEYKLYNMNYIMFVVNLPKYKCNNSNSARQAQQIPVFKLLHFTVLVPEQLSPGHLIRTSKTAQILNLFLSFLNCFYRESNPAPPIYGPPQLSRVTKIKKCVTS